MPSVNARQAADLTGKDRSTILRAVESGRLSASKDERGHYVFDPAELERVYGTLRVPDASADAVRDDTYALHEAAHAREVALLRELIEVHERDSRQWQEERTFLRRLVEQHAEQIKLLTDARAEAERRPVERPSFLARLFRRE